MLNLYQTGTEGSTEANLFNLLRTEAYQMIDQTDDLKGKKLASFIAGNVMEALYKISTAAKTAIYRADQIARDAQNVQKAIETKGYFSPMDLRAEDVANLHEAREQVSTSQRDLRSFCQLALDSGFEFPAAETYLADTESYL